MKLNKMLLADVQGVQKVLGMSNEELLDLFKGMLKDWEKTNSSQCPLVSMVFSKRNGLEQMNEISWKESEKDWHSNDTYTFQPFGRPGSSWWFDLKWARRKEQMKLLIKYFLGGSGNETQ